MSDVPDHAPPVGEEVHLPGPSILPFVTAIGITLMVIGTTINWIFSGSGSRSSSSPSASGSATPGAT